ncbi:STT3 domain-containing protein [Megalodesulfovibrio paquesii]
MLAPWNVDPASEGPTRRDVKLFLFILGLAYLLSLAAHMQEFNAWMDPSLMVDGEFIQGTHDSYHWLAGAKGVGEATGTPLAVLAAWFHTLTGLPLGMGSFVLPALFAGVVGAVMVLWCRLLGWREGAYAGGLAAGLLTVLAPGFYFRTRLGYYDTDMVTLLFPLLYTLGMALACGPWLRERWLTAESMPEEPPHAVARLLVWMTCIGLAARYGGTWHGHVLTFAKGLCLLGVGWCLLTARSGARGRLMLGMAMFMASAFVGWVGLGLSLALICLAWKAPQQAERLWKTPWPALLGMVLLAVFGGVAGTAGQSVMEFLGAYLKPAADLASSSNNTGVVYPGIGQSVIEVQNLPLNQVLERFHTSSAVAAVGILCFVGVLVLRPVALPLVVFLAMGLASVKLGSRLAMFGGAPVALGLGMGVSWAGVVLFRGSRFAAYKKLALGLVAAGVLCWPLISFYLILPATPVLSRQHCQALEYLNTASPRDSKVWTWWDWGYPTHYYAERISFADGGRHYGHHIFTLGLVLTTPNPLLASQLIKYSAQHGDEPWTVWNEMPRDEVLNLLKELGRTPREFPPAAPRYVVATFENIRLAPWITYYGTWDMFTKQGQHGRIMEIREAFRINYDRGELEFVAGKGQEGGVLPVASVDVLDAKGRRSGTYPANKGAHLVVHLAAQKYYLLDDQIYNSMLVQLLLEDPQAPRFGEYFKLVYEGFPDVRIFEVR